MKPFGVVFEPHEVVERVRTFIVGGKWATLTGLESVVPVKVAL